MDSTHATARFTSDDFRLDAQSTPCLSALPHAKTPEEPAASPATPEPEGLLGPNRSTCLPHVHEETSLPFTNAASPNHSNLVGNRDLPQPPITDSWPPREEGDHPAPQDPAPRLFTADKGHRRDTSACSSVYSEASAVEQAGDAQSRYAEMLTALDRIHWLYSLYASAACWSLLVGFIAMSQALARISPDFPDKPEQGALKRVFTDVSLFSVAGAASGGGLILITILGVQWRGNYVWILHNLFLPGTLNALAGLVSTLISIFLLNKGKWDTFSIVTLAVVGGVTVAGVLAMATCYYHISRLRKEHELAIGKHRAGKAWGGRYRGFEH